jgi:hypothetical protein
MHNNEFSVKMLRISGRLQGALTAILWLLIIYGFDEPYVAGLTIISALIHEGGHLLSFFLLSLGKIGFSGRLSGPRLTGVGVTSYKEDILIFASGPLMNIAAAALSLPFLRISGGTGYIRSFAVMNIATAISNLLPTSGRDGYGIIEALIAERNLGDGAHRVLRAVSILLSSLGCILALYFMQRIGESFWIFFVFYFSVLSELSEASKRVF